MKTGISRLLAGTGERVQGLVIPNDESNRQISGQPPPAKPDGAAQASPRGRRNERRAERNAAERGTSSFAGRHGPRRARGWQDLQEAARSAERLDRVATRRGRGLLGPNGAGKTTDFYMIVGLVRPDTGSISLDGAEITSLPMYRRARLGIGYLPQEASVFRGLNVEQNVMAVLEVVEPDPDSRALMFDELLADSASAICGGPLRWRYPAASVGASRLPGRWRRSPPTSCWTSRWRGSTRSPSAKSATWCRI